MTSEPLRIALVQMSCEAEPRRNLDKALARIEEAAARGAKVICLQELFRSRYFCQSEEAGNFDLAEPIPGPSTEALGEWPPRARWSSSLRCSSAVPRASTTTRRS